MSLRLVTLAERRARLGIRHRLCSSLATPTSVADLSDDLVVLHATDPATVYLAVGARMAGTGPQDVDIALFDDRTVFRTLAMRRTLFVTSTAMAPAVERSSAGAVAAAERKRLEQFLADSEIDDPKGWLDEAFAAVLDALAECESDGMAARQLTRTVPILATRIMMGAGTKHPVEAGATSRVLGLMAVEGRLIRGRPGGDWTTRQYRWHRRDRWWPADRHPDLAPDAQSGRGSDSDGLDEETASQELLNHWLRRFGPATVADMKWWTGWTVTKTKRALAELDTASVTVEDGAGNQMPAYLLADDLDPVDEPEPWAALLPSLDPTPMGWKERDWYLGPHRGPLFDRNGNIGPTVWLDGRIVGGWSQDPSGQVVTALLESVEPGQQALIDAAVARTINFVGDTVIKPSFPTPLQKELSAGSTAVEGFQ